MKTYSAPFQALVIVVFSLLITLFYFQYDSMLLEWAVSLQLRTHFYLQSFAKTPEALASIAFLFLIISWLRNFKKQKTNFDYFMILYSLSVTISFFLKICFKNIFSRYWPEIWKGNTIYFVKSKHYGFHWFHMGDNFQAFPSGHMTVATASLLTVAYCSKWLRWPALILLVLIGFDTVLLYFHYASDVLAGFLLGYLVCANLRKNFLQIGD